MMNDDDKQGQTTGETKADEGQGDTGTTGNEGETSKAAEGDEKADTGAEKAAE